MITAIILISLAFGYLGYETNWFTIRLPYGKPLQSKSSGLKRKRNNTGLPKPKLPEETGDDTTEQNPVIFDPLEMPDTEGNIKIVCVRE